MKNEIIMAIVSLICATISAFVTFFLTKRKYNAEVDNQQIQNMKESFEAYKQMMEEVLELQNQKIDILEKDNRDLREQVNQLQGQLVSLVTSKAKSSRKNL